MDTNHLPDLAIFVTVHSHAKRYLDLLRELAGIFFLHTNIIP